MALAFTVSVIFVLLLISEILSRKKHLHAELSRKFVHITVGSFVAFWPYFLSIDDIKLLSLAFLAIVALSKYLHIFRAIHSVQRPTWGEFWFAFVVGLLAFIAGQHPHIYTAALLEMSLADGLAAVIGTHYGNRYRYSVFGTPKSIVGTITFFVVSCLILTISSIVLSSVLPLSLIMSIALSATILENIAVNGLDNLVVPLFVAGALLLFT